MKRLGMRRLAASAVTITAMVGAVALSGPAMASAAPTVDAPVLTVEQGDFGEKNVQVTTENPNAAFSACVPLLVSGDTALRVLVAYSAGDTDALVKELTSDGVEIGKVAYEASFLGKKNPSVTTWQVNEGVYLLAGACKDAGINDIRKIIKGDFKGLLSPDTTAFNVQPLIVPDGIGSLSPALAFGSLALETPGAFESLLPLLTGGGLGDLIGDVGSAE